MREQSASKLTWMVDLRLRPDACRNESFDNRRRFVLDITISSLIIYIWYEGGRLRQRLVKR